MTEQLEATELEAYEGQQSQFRLNPFRTIWRHKGLTALGVALGCAIGALFYARATPIYQSGAQVLVVKKNPDPLPTSVGEAHAAAEDYLSTHQTLIRSPVVVGDAVKIGKLSELKSFNGRDPTGEIINGLKVTREMNAGSPTNVLNISYRGTNPQDCAVVIAEVVASYQRFLNLRYKIVNDETSKLIADANEILDKKIKQKEEDYAKFSVEHPELWRGALNGLSPLQQHLLALQDKRSLLMLQEAETRGRLESFDRAIKENRYTRAELLAMITQASGRLGSDPTQTTSTLEERLATLELQEKTLLEDYGKDHPQVRLTRSQIALLRTLLGRTGKDATAEEAARLDPVKIHRQVMQLELENTRMAVAAVSQLLKDEQQNMKGSRAFEKQEETMRGDIDRSKVLLDAISRRLDEVSILKNFTGGFEAATIAEPGPGGKVYPSALAVFTGASLLGLLAGFGLAYLAELSDQSFRTPEEIRRRLGLPIVGHIPFFGGAEGEAQPAGPDAPEPLYDPILCTIDHPKSRESEAYRGVRTAVLFSARDGLCKVVQVTSPDMGDGKTTLVTNLAVSIAQSGKRVLVIDADLRRPQVHKLFHLSSKVGLSSVITGEAEVADAIQSTPVAGLFVLPSGPIPPNPAELLTQPRFRELLGALRNQYDFVLVDTPPLLAVTDPCVVVPYVDGVLLTVRISKNARPHASRAKEILSTLGARVLGVVVNGVGRDAKGYGYDGYRYGYSYKYYSEYSSEENASYYAGESNGGAEDGEPANGGTRTNGQHKAARRRSSHHKKGFLAWLFQR